MSSASSTEWPAFFTLSGDRYVPRDLARGFWSRETISGPPACGIVARELENAYLASEPEFFPARLTVDLSRPVPAEPLLVRTRLSRDGRRIRVADAEVFGTDDENAVARATAVFLRRSAQPPGAVWRPRSARPVPGDDDPPPEVTPVYGSDIGWSGDISAHRDSSRKRLWVRRIAAVHGELPSPFIKAAIVGEQASFVTNWGSMGVEFINVDATLNLARLPVGTGLGVEAEAHLSDDGIAACAATLFDTEGPVGICTVTALAAVDRRLDLSRGVTAARRLSAMRRHRVFWIAGGMVVIGVLLHVLIRAWKVAAAAGWPACRRRG